MWIAPEEVKMCLPRFRLLGNTFEIISENILQMILPTSQQRMDKSTFL